MSIWKEQDWAWRLAAIVGLLSAIVLPLMVYSDLVHTPFGRPSRDTPDYLPWDANDAGFVIMWCVGVLALWLPMLTWRQPAWLWGAVWAGIGLVLVADTARFPLPGQRPESVSVVALLVQFAVVAAQIWVSREAACRGWKPLKGGRRRDTCKSHTLWRNAPLIWRVLGISGASAVCMAVGVYFLGSRDLSNMTFPDTILECIACLILIVLAVAVILLWRVLMVNGRGWLFWLLLWGLCIPGFTTLMWSFVEYWKTLATGLPSTLHELRRLEVDASVTLVLVVLAVGQIWVALKAREMQRQQAASEMRQLD